MKELIKTFLKSNPIGRSVYTGLHKIYRAYQGPREIKRLHRYGYEALSRLHKALTDANVPYYCEAGTMLGIVRDHGFIKTDDDIDIAIMPDVVKPHYVLEKLLAAGFKFVHGFTYEGRVLEFTIRDVSGIPIDVFFHLYTDNSRMREYQTFLRWYPDRKYPDVMANNALRFNFVAPCGLKSVEVHGVETRIPVNAEDVLDSEYGPWRVPDPNFKSDSLKYVELPGFAYRKLSVDELGDK